MVSCGAIALRGTFGVLFISPLPGSSMENAFRVEWKYVSNGAGGRLISRYEDLTGFSSGMIKP